MSDDARKARQRHLGRANKQKGSRVERELRDIFRSYGYESERIPLSGAWVGLKGDVTFTKGGVTRKAEVKSRRDGFKKIYDLYADHIREFKDDKVCFACDGVLVQLSTSLEAVFEDSGIFPMLNHHPLFKKYSRTFGKIKNLQKLVGECDVLAVRDDRKPFIFIRYR